MVNALQECHRVLAPDGLLIDLRPIASTAPIEVVAAGGVVQTGGVDGAPGIPDDVASERALEIAVGKGWFELTTSLQFDFNFYWDSVDEMATYFVEHWVRRRGDVTDTDMQATRAAWEAAAAHSPRLRSKEAMLLATYRRTHSP